MLGVTAPRDFAFVIAMTFGGIWIASVTIFILVVSQSRWYAFHMAGIRLSFTRRSRLPIPMNIMPMLDDYYRLGLLRRVGPIYQFRHAELQDHLAPPRS